MSNKFEQLLDYLVNEEHEKANELFHEIVVEKSRSIYENLIAEESDEDEEMDEAREEDDESVDESTEEDDEEMDEAREEDDESVEEGFGDEEESMMEIGGDPADEFVDSVVDHDAPGMHDAGEEHMGGDLDAPATKADVMDVKDELEELENMFRDLMGHEEHEEEFGDEKDEEDSEEDSEEADDEEAADESFVREYRELVRGKQKDYTSGSPGEEKVNAKSSINANPSDRPVTKATAKNIAQSGKGSSEDGTKTNMGPESKSLAGGVKGKFTDGSTLNVDGKQTKGYDKSTKKPSKEQNVNDKNVLPK